RAIRRRGSTHLAWTACRKSASTCARPIRGRRSFPAFPRYAFTSDRIDARKLSRAVVGARRTDRLEQLVAAIRAGGGTAEYQAVDVTKREQVEALVRLAKTKFGQV